MFLLRYIIKILNVIPAILGFSSKKYYLSEKKFSTAMFKGPLIIVQNHKSFMDYPIILLMFAFRKVTVVVSELLYEHSGVLTFFLKVFGVIKADRFSGDPTFINESVTTLKKGGIILIYPESKIETEDEIYEFKKSVGVISIKSGAPVLPIFHNGNIGPFHRDVCLLGDLMYPQDFCEEGKSLAENADEFTKNIRDKIVQFKDLYDTYLVKKERKKDLSLWRKFAYIFVKNSAVPLIKLYSNPVVKYENANARILPYNKNKMLIASNHTWWLDSTIIYYIFRRRIVKCVAAKDVAEKHSFAHKMQEIMGCLFLDRDVFDWGCIKSCISHLKNEGTLLVFPEGRLNCSDELLEFKQGSILMAYTAQAPIVPIYIDGGYKPFGKIHVIVGEAMKPEDYMPSDELVSDKMAEANMRVFNKINELKNKTEVGLSRNEKEIIYSVKEKHKLHLLKTVKESTNK